MKTELVRVDLGERGYDVLVWTGLLDRIDEVLDAGRWARALVVSDLEVGPLYGARVLAGLERLGVEAELLAIEPGEGSKSLEELGRILDGMAGFRLTRSDLVLALGGGVVGDLAGFAASTFKRGLDLVQAPTTLMSQVDSAIGGKTAVNLASGKNLAGTFHQPVKVVCDVVALSTLPARELAGGLAEVVKYSLIDPEIVLDDETAASLQALEPDDLVSTVAACARAKARVVAEDEMDRGGVRAVLNYGHTLGHALETATGYGGTYTHGEAVSVGMVFAAMVAERLGMGAGGLASRHRRSLARFGLPVAPPEPRPPFEELLEVMLQDKKSAGDLTMVLLEEEGSPSLRRCIDPGVLRDCYERMGETE
ncbi:MAG: 3-dehydroquinate synthase [Actinomycetota bacterium]